MINLLPKEKKIQPLSSNLSRITLITGTTVIVFGLCFFAGYLCHQISLHQTGLEQLNMEFKCYNTLYRKAQQLETALNGIREKDRVKQTVYADYLAPLHVLNTLIQSKPDLIWFERIEFNGMDGGFSVTGGTVNYKALAGFIGQLEQNKAAFTQLKPEQAAIYDNSAGREYVQFKISGILVKRSETGAQNY